MKLSKIEDKLKVLSDLVVVRNQIKTLASNSLNVINREQIKQANSVANMLDKLFVESCLDVLLPELQATDTKTVSKEELKEITTDTEPLVIKKSTKKLPKESTSNV